LVDARCDASVTSHKGRDIIQMGPKHPACIDQHLIQHGEQIVRDLREARLSVITAESCTGGLLSAVLSQAEGAGKVLHGSFVTYSKENKTKALGVDPLLLKRDGSVTADVVRQMVLGALLRSPAEIALAVSGVLGPSPDEDGNPVGLVYFGCGRRDEPVAVTRKDYGELPHDSLRHCVVMDGLHLLAQGIHRK
jgi:nicotinamide-nucleotide amidase